MNNINLQQLAEYIYEFCGIDYLKNLPSLESKIANRLKELGLSLWEYCGYVKVEEKERDILIELITVNETYFFREENLLNELQTVIFPKFKERIKERPLRIWCAACSSGEEPYTLGMLINETSLFSQGSVEIIASDINKKVLRKAEKALYYKKSLSFRKMPEGMTEKYFEEEGEYYRVKDEVRKIVKFKHLNMFNKNVGSEIGKVDIILSRNVLIYFDIEAIKKVVKTFNDILNIPGYLFLGHAETITSINPGFETIYTPSIFYYKKGENQV
ncbi:CheR family methyltransferase [Clostridium magnum]|uniref:protein-glutamate O-methyltransferase n=1 Tax=Clostridium magnum DSM 2767 TaxID=1121326 RepID=A0A162T7K6_9CLOT|nr:protein-glutamate O-methyltransferase CheR [Clostridium magnum]KZL92329.1 chemotaxis protein methyltransferase cher2 [Clostridium magnum DSM 2767]SHH13162.1 chemotaxis protein methyltransferase CheR [Clostridium magnum DSM 2767]